MWMPFLKFICTKLQENIAMDRVWTSTFRAQGVQLPGKPGNVREFRCKVKSQGKVREFFKNKKSQGKVREFCCVKFIFSQSEHPNFENFIWGACPLNSIRHT